MGRSQRAKGGRRERELVQMLKSWGLKSVRVGHETSNIADVDVYRPGRDAPFCGECKARKDGFKQLYAWLDKEGADYLALRADNEEWIFVLPERVMRELLVQ